MSRGIRRPAPDVTGECFDDVVLPHLDAALRLARWLMRNEHDAEDAVQEASLRAFRYFRTFTGGNGLAWFLRIVRNTCSGWHRLRSQVSIDRFEEEWHSDAHGAADPETLLLHGDAAAAVDHAMNRLPERLRELLILREIGGLSYRQMADLRGIPIGTVMSGLSRARQAFRTAVNDEPERPTRFHGSRAKPSEAGRSNARGIALENDLIHRTPREVSRQRRAATGRTRDAGGHVPHEQLTPAAPPTTTTPHVLPLSSRHPSARSRPQPR